MNKAIKWLLILLATPLLLVVAAMAYITQVFDPNSLRPQIEQAAQEQGVPLRLNGPVRWQWYPRLGLSLADVEVRAGQAEFARIASLATEVAIEPLFEGRLAIEGIRVQGVALTLRQDANGRGNWQDLSGASAASQPNNQPATATPAPTSDLAASQQGAEADVDLAIDRLEILDLTVAYRDDAAQQQSQIAIPSCVIDRFNLSGQPFQLDCQTRVQFADYPAVAAHSRGTLSYEAESTTLTLAPLQQTLTLNQTTLEINLKGDVRSQNNSVALDLLLAPTNARAWLEGLGVEVPDMAKASALYSLSLTTRVVAEAEQWQLQDLEIQLDGTTLRGSVAQNTQQQFAVVLQGDHVNLDDYLPAADAEVEADVEKETAKGGAASTSSTHSASHSSPGSSKGPASRRLSSKPLDFSALQDISASIDARFAGLQIAATQLTDVQLQAQLNNGVLELTQLQSRIYDGELQASGVLNARTSNPTLTGKVGLQGVALQPLLQNFADEKRLSGQASVDVDVAVKGNSLAAWQQSLNGSAALSAEALQVAELDIERDFCEMAALLNRKPTPEIDWRGRTDLQNVRARLALQGERITIAQLEAGVEELAVSATGNSRYIQGDFDVRGALRVTGAANPDRACQIRDRWRNRDLPMRCRGNIDEPLSGKVCGPDRGRLDDLLKDEVKGRVEEKLQEKLQEKLNLDDENAKQVEQLLRGIFGR